MPRHAGRNAKRADYQVVRLTKADFKVAQAYITARHYAGGTANTAIAIHGLLRGDLLVGVAWWMLPSSPRAAKFTARLYGDEAAFRQVLTLSRLVVDGDEPRNAASLLLGGAIRDLRKSKKYKYLVSFADEGEGHTGTVYRATGWVESGWTEPTERWVDETGRHVALKATKTRTVAQMLALGLARVGKTRKKRFTMAL